MRARLRPLLLWLAQWFADRADGDGHAYIVVCAGCQHVAQREAMDTAFRLGRASAQLAPVNPRRPVAPAIGEA